MIPLAVVEPVVEGQTNGHSTVSVVERVVSMESIVYVIHSLTTSEVVCKHVLRFLCVADVGRKTTVGEVEQVLNRAFLCLYRRWGCRPLLFRNDYFRLCCAWFALYIFTLSINRGGAKKNRSHYQQYACKCTSCFHNLFIV